MIVSESPTIPAQWGQNGTLAVGALYGYNLEAICPLRHGRSSRGGGRMDKKVLPKRKKDRTVHPDLERAMAKRMNATTYELDSSHVPMLSQPERVLEVIRAAAKAVQGATAAA